MSGLADEKELLEAAFELDPDILKSPSQIDKNDEKSSTSTRQPKVFTFDKDDDEESGGSGALDFVTL